MEKTELPGVSKMNKLPYLFIFACNYFFGQITGEWHAAFSVAGQSTRLDLFIDRVGRDGTIKIGLPDVSGFETKIIENSTISKDSLAFSWENIGLSFSGKYVSSGDSLFGMMKQSGLEWKVTFKREIQATKKVNRPQEPKPKFPYEIKEIEIKNGKNVIGATLTLPKGNTKFPIVILSSGSGPQNRDCEIMGHKPFWVIADYLTTNGIGVLRFDDRGVGKSTGEFSKASLFDFASDVETCYKYVKKIFKGHKIGLAGHSGKSESYAKANSMVYDSVTSILMSHDNKSFPTEVNNFLKRNFDQFPEDYKKEGTMEEFSTSLTNFLNNDWARQFMQFNSCDYLSKIYCPILVINGSEDIQVPPTKNQDGFRNGFSIQSKSLNRSKIILVPGLNHLMQSCKSCAIMEYGDLEETFSPIVLKSMADWINNPLLFEKH